MAGRPTKYNKDMQAKAELYLESGYLDDGYVIPSIEGLARVLDVSRPAIYDWKEQHAEFSYTLGRIEAKQKELTLNSGLKGDFNSTIAKLVLANHGMHDKADTTATMNVVVESDSFDIG